MRFGIKAASRKIAGQAPGAPAARTKQLRVEQLGDGGQKPLPNTDYVYAPAGGPAPLDEFALGNASLCLTHRGYDFVLLSRSPAPPPRIVAPGPLRHSVVFARDLSDVFLAGAPPARRLSGRVIRAPGLRGDAEETDLEHLFPGAVAGGEPTEFVWGPGSGEALRTWDASDMAFATVAPKSKPRVFVWPALWAVGGVERNTIEIMRHLRGHYDFILITTEPVHEGHGSLHHQLKGLATAVYDLGELGPTSHYLSMFATLKRAWSPDLVWICNGSPWLADHAADLRRIYADTPIVDQQVYDTRAGWINRYHEAGIQSFDRFIAINQRIRETFVDRLGMDPGRIDLIYPAFDASRFRLTPVTPEQAADSKRAFGLAPDRPVFLFLGRMSAQKRPLDFINLAARVLASGLQASFLMVGDGEMGGEVDQAITASSTEALKRFPFTDRIPEILSVVDGLIITSEFEGLPVAMLEALAMGVPVLSTDVGDVRLVIEEFGVGAIVDRIGDPRTLLEAFEAWRLDLPRFRRAAAAASPRVAQRFSAATLAGQYDESWRRALQVRLRE